MAFNPLGFVGGLGKKGLGAIDDTFSGETVDPYKPDKSDFYAGSGSGFFDEGKAAQGTKAPQADLTGYNQMRGLGLQSRDAIGAQIHNIRQAAYDPNYSVAQQQLRSGQDANLRQSLALARSGGGSGAAQAQALRQAQFAGAQSNQQLNAQSATLRAAEVQAANQQASQLLSQQRAMDLQAQGLDAQTALAQAQLEMQQRGLNNQMQLGLYGIGAGYDMANQQGNIAYHQLMGQQQLGSQTANQQADAARDSSLAGMGGAALGGLIALSDVRSKTDIEPTSGNMYKGLSDAFEGMVERVQANREADARAREQRRLYYGLQPGDPALELEGDDFYIEMGDRGWLGNSNIIDAQRRRRANADPLAAPGYGDAQGHPRAGTWLYELKGRGLLPGETAGPRPPMYTGSTPAAREYIQPGFYGSSMAPPSDARSKEQIQSLERRNSALETALASVTRGSGTGGTFDRETLRAAPGMRRQVAPEETVARARAEELARRNEVMGALRRQMGEEAMEAAAVEQYERDTARTRAQDQRIMNAAEAARQGAADIYFRPNPPGVPQRTPPGAGVVSDRESKQEISALRAALDRVRDEQISGIRGVPTRRFDDMPPAVRAQADLPAYTFRYREPFAQQYGGERRVGVMAQDLERNPLYAPAVKTGPDGLKRVDAGQATMANIAADAELARIVEDQERRLRSIERLPPFAKPRGF